MKISRAIINTRETTNPYGLPSSNSFDFSFFLLFKSRDSDCAALLSVWRPRCDGWAVVK